MVAICVVLVFEDGTACVTLNYQWVMISTNWLPFVVFDDASRMSMGMNLIEPLAGKILSCLVRVIFAW